MSETTTWLTQEAYDRLKAEFEHLTGPGRDEIVARIAAARAEGDLSENGGYHAAREALGLNEARATELRAKLDKARVGTPPDDGVIEAGMVVEASVAGNDMRFLLGSREIDGSGLDVYSPDSPLGAAIYGRAVGEKVSYTAPNGKDIKVVIKDAKPYTG
ncbi:MAG: transcription elongation factor GreA [Actinomycetota bacterium]|nr:transcription elongation factor GreA [Actinomycetota bacterium]